MIKIGGEMIKLLTTKESTLLRKLANLLKEYDAIISCDTSDEVKIIVFEGDKDVHDNKEGVTVPGYSNNQTNAFSPIDKITELYERLLKEKDEKYAALEQRIQNLEKQK